jgi:Mce-associated membrane protein
MQKMNSIEHDEHGDTAEPAEAVTPVVADDESAESEPAGASDSDATVDSRVDDEDKITPTRRQISISVRALMVGVVIVCLVAAVGVMTWLYIGADARLDDHAQQAADVKHAEQVALDYAVSAAIMDFKDMGPWKQNLVKGTTPELSDKLTKAADAMEQIVLPLQWVSTAKPLAAKVRSQDKGVYVVDAFVSVMTKTVQASDSLQSTATYSITIDSNRNWLITDVGGIAAMVGDK